MSRLAPRILGSHASAVLVETIDGDAILVPHRDFTVGRQLRFGGEYARSELSMLGDVVASAGLTSALVVGAHVGALAIPLARHVDEMAVVEANPDTYALLERNLLLNGLPHVEALHAAASSRDATIEFLMSVSNSGASKIVPAHRDAKYYDDDPTTCTVPARRLDDVFAGRSFDLIVMDIEGSEIDALRGMPTLLAAARVVSIEFVPHHIERVAAATLDDFLSPLAGFDHAVVAGSRFATGAPLRARLAEMVETNESADSIVFRRD